MIVFPSSISWSVDWGIKRRTVDPSGGGPSVDVVVPAHNAAPFLDQALASLVTQTRPADEVVVFDDGSEDQTFATAKRWSAVLPLRVLRSSQPRGAWYARNEAVSNSRADLIAQLDADDMPAAAASGARPRSSRLMERAGRGFPRHPPPPKVLGSQNGQLLRQPPEAGPARGEEGHLIGLR